MSPWMLMLMRVRRGPFSGLLPGLGGSQLPQHRAFFCVKTATQKNCRFSDKRTAGKCPRIDPADLHIDACWSVPSYDSLEAVPLELAEDFAVGVQCRVSVFSSIEDDGWTELKMRDRIIYLQTPSFVIDDTTNKTLEMPSQKREADEYCREHGIKVLSTRWVAVEKKDGETKEEIVRARVVARDYASGSPTAAELGISSPTSSNEAFRSFLVFVSATESDIVLARCFDGILVRAHCFS